MMSVEADQPVEFSFMMEDSVVILRPHRIDEDIYKISYNMIGHGWGLQNELIKMDNEFPKDG